MRFTIIGTIVLITVILLLVLNKKFEKELYEPVVAGIQDEKIKMIFGGDAKRILIEKPYYHLKIISDDEKLLGYIFSSEDMLIINHGYKTKVKVIVALDASIKIKKIVLHNIKESPEHVAKIRKNGMIEKWKGKGVEDFPPDIITGATKTSSAINKSVKEILNKIKYMEWGIMRNKWS